MTENCDPSSTNIPPYMRERAVQMKELYALVGEFVVSFEAILGEMRQHLAFFMCHSGSTSMSDIYALTGEMTAGPLLSSYVSIMISHCQEGDRPYFVALSSRIRKMTEQRNTIVHGTWFVGYGNGPQTDFSVGFGEKVKNSNTGVMHRKLKLTEADFRPLIKECWALADLVTGMTLSVTLGRSVTGFCELSGSDSQTLRRRQDTPPV